MKKALLVVFAMLTVMSASALNETVANLSNSFKEGDFYTIRETVPMVRNVVSQKDKQNIYNDLDLTMCDYFEALSSQFLMDDINDAESKVALSRRTLGDDHHITLTLQALSQEDSNEGLKYVDRALEAIEDDLGTESWQYAAMTYKKTELLIDLGRIDEALALASKVQQSYTGTPLENSWLNGCLHIFQSLCNLHLQNIDGMLPGYNSAVGIYKTINKNIDEDKLNPLAVCGNAHLGLFMTMLSRVFGYNDAVIVTSEEMLPLLKQLKMGSTGLADGYRTSLATAYIYNKDYDKGRAIITEYMTRLEKNGEKDSERYIYLNGLLNKIP